MLSDRVLLLDCDELETMEASRNNAISRFIETINCPLIITSRDRRRQRQRPLITFDVHQPTSEEQQLIWQNALGNIAPSFQGHVETLVSHFSLSPTDIQTASLRVKSLAKKIEGPQTALGRVGVPDDIGGVIASLLSEENRWVNAQRIEVSGGQSL
ncbi:hypothetical protein [Nostoc sp.]|uniref:hypothetical protein n=1 Tax=Nostoc sp. TaxID=1180 RepID=UPI002FF86387